MLFRSEQSKNHLTSKEFKKLSSIYKTHVSLSDVMVKLKLRLVDTSDVSSQKLHQAISLLHTKYTEQIGKYSIGEKRLLRAFPYLSLSHLKKLHHQKNSSRKEDL